MQIDWARFPTLVIALVVVIAGAIVTIVHPETLSFSDYVRNVAIAVGLLGIAYAHDSKSTP